MENEQNFWEDGFFNFGKIIKIIAMLKLIIIICIIPTAIAINFLYFSFPSPWSSNSRIILVTLNLISSILLAITSFIIIFYFRSALKNIDFQPELEKAQFQKFYYYLISMVIFIIEAFIPEDPLALTPSIFFFEWYLLFFIYLGIPIIRFNACIFEIIGWKKLIQFFLSIKKGLYFTNITKKSMLVNRKKLVFANFLILISSIPILIRFPSFWIFPSLEIIGNIILINGLINLAKLIKNIK